MNRLNDVFGRRIYKADSTFVGTAKDVLIDPAEGRIKYLLKDDVDLLLNKDKLEARQFIRKNFIPFEKVTAVGDIIIVKD